MLNPPEDRVLLQPGLLQVATPIESTAERAREKAASVFVKASKGLSLEQFFQSAIKVVANVAAPEDGARDFIGARLMKGVTNHLAGLGEGFFGGGVKFMRVADDLSRQDFLLIEPLIADDHFIWVNYDVVRHTPFSGVGDVGDWIDEAFDFVRGSAMRILEGA
jgi:hypothetical protein